MSFLEWLADLMRQNTTMPIFLTIGLGFWLGRLKYKSFSLGSVAATLIIGVIIGQIGIKIPNEIKSIFFMLFLFSIAYSVGPQFFRAFKGQGLKQVAFAVLEAIICAGTVIAAAKIMGYDTGVALGMFAGSQTASASLGVASETVRGLTMTAGLKEHILEMIPICYAVTYVFGTIGSAWFLSNIGPILLGGLQKVKEENARIEAEMDAGEFQVEPGYIVANRPVSFRAYKCESALFDKPITVAQIEELFREKGQRIFVERARVNGVIKEVSPGLKIHKGDVIVLNGRRESLVEDAPDFGPEIADHELLSFGVERLPVTLSKKGAHRLTFGALRNAPYMKGVLVSSLTRNGIALPGRAKTELHPGDVVTLVGLTRDVLEAAAAIGFPDRHTRETDMVFLGLGLAFGCFIGMLSIKLGGIPLSLSSSGGVLLAGLFLGWLRNSHPTFSRIPTQVVWIFDNLGLNMFIAVVGLTSGASFIGGIHSVGIGLFFVGAICTLFALTVNIFIARKIFHFDRSETLGCVAGARCGVASIGAIQDALDSDLPAIGYTVTYAVANLILVFSSLLVLAFV